MLPAAGAKWISSPTGSSAVISPETIAFLRTLDATRPGALRELIGLFALDAPILIQRLFGSHAMQDWLGLRQAAHYLRSGSLALGLVDVEARARQIEHDSVAAFQNADFSERLQALRDSVEEALAALRALSNDGQASLEQN